MKRFDRRAHQWMAWAILVVAMLIYAIDMSHQAILRYTTFKATAFDLGNMDQVLWNTLHGRLFQFTNQAIDWYGPPIRLAQHVEPIILPLSLLYVFGADPRILLVFQTVVLVSGALPVFLLTRKYIPEWPLAASIMAIAYLLSPALIGLNIFDFHPVALATPLLLYAVLALTYKRYGWFLITCILAAACKEEVPLCIAMLGILVIWRYKLPRLGTVLIVGGCLWSFLAFFVVMPHFFPGQQHNNFWYRYQVLGSTPEAAVVNVLLHPWILFTAFITFDRFFYLAGLFRSTGFLGLLAPEWLLPALPSLAINLLSTDPLLYSGVYHYNALIIPFVMISAIHGARRVITYWHQWRGEKAQAVELVQEAGESKTLGRSYAHSPHIVSAALLAGGTLRLPWSTWRVQLYEWWKPASFKVGQDVIVWLAKVGEWFSGLVLRSWQRFSERMKPLARSLPVPQLQWLACGWIISMFVLNYVIAMPSLSSFWADHEPGSREQHIQQILNLIPPDASVSAGDNLNPHLSERERLAVFPSPLNTSVQYIIVDLGDVFPEDRNEMASELNQLVASGQFREVARAEGVVLLVRRST